jgi:hypothetical protein
VHALSGKSLTLPAGPTIAVARLFRGAAIPRAQDLRAQGLRASLALPDPAEAGLGLRRGLMLAVAPGATAALLVVLSPAPRADHGVARSESAQAALARRMRRRRSDERSSSFRPPQVPYFSGLLTA